MFNRPVETAALAVSIVICAFATAANGAETAPSPLGLPRLAGPDSSRAGQPPALAAQRYEVDPLVARAGAGDQRSRSEHALRFLDLDPGAVWSRPLRDNERKPVFVSFLLYASIGTEVRIGAVSLRIVEAPTDGGAQVMYAQDRPGGRAWQPLGMHAPLEAFDGRTFAGLRVITVRLDPVEGTWDLYLGARLSHVALPLLSERPVRGRADVAIRAGAAGARLFGLVQSSEHPIYEDANDNGVDDAFERAREGGRLNRRTLTADERRQLAEDWKRESGPPLALLVRRPLPDAN